MDLKALFDRTVSYAGSRIGRCASQGLLKEIAEGAVSLSQAEWFRRINENIPDDRSVQLVDFCSGPGVAFTHGFARCHPAVDVFLVDRLDYLPPGIFSEVALKALRENGRTREDIERKVRAGHLWYSMPPLQVEDVSEMMRVIFVHNRVENMRYCGIMLDGSDKLAGIISRDKTTYCVGRRCPNVAGFYAIQQSVVSGADAVAVNVAGLACIPGKMKASSRVDGELEAVDSPDFVSRHLRALDFLMFLEENGYSTRLLFIDDLRLNMDGEPEHLIYGYKDRDILA